MIALPSTTSFEGKGALERLDGHFCCAMVGPSFGENSSRMCRAPVSFNFSFTIWILDPAGEGDRTIMGEHVAIERIEGGVVDVGNQHTFEQIIQHQNARSPA